MNKTELVEKILGETISNDVKKEMEMLKETVYKDLWQENTKKDTIIKTPLDTSIVISRGRISFDGGKTYIHRSEEKLIKENLDKLEKGVVNYVISELASESDSEFDNNKGTQEYKKSREEKVRVDDDTELLNNLLGILDHVPDYIQKNIFHSTTLLSELKIIDEQIALLKEIGGNKEKILALLEEKHKVLKELKHL